MPPLPAQHCSSMFDPKIKYSPCFMPLMMHLKIVIKYFHVTAGTLHIMQKNGGIPFVHHFIHTAASLRLNYWMSINAAISPELNFLNYRAMQYGMSSTGRAEHQSSL